MNTPRKILAITAVVIITNLGLFLFVFDKRPGPNPAAPGKEPAGTASSGEDTASPVKIVPVRRGKLVITLKSPGEAVAEKKIALKAEVSGRIKNLNIKEGKHVREGEVLLELEDEEYALRFERAEALRLRYLSEMFLEMQFAGSRKELDPKALERVRKSEEELLWAGSLFEKRLLSKEGFEKAKKKHELVLIETGMKKEAVQASAKGLTQAEIDVKIALLDLDKTRIRAPFSGVITGIMVSSQETVSASRDLFTLVDVSPIKILARVLETEAGKIRAGQEADLRFIAYPGKIFRGKVDAVSPVIDPGDKTCEVHIIVENREEQIKPGMHAEVEIAADIYRDRLIVPQEALLVRGGRKLVFVAKESLAKWRYIEVGLENEDYAEVLDGVKEGEMVITEGHLTLVHDAKIQVIKQ